MDWSRYFWLSTRGVSASEKLCTIACETRVAGLGSPPYVADRGRYHQVGSIVPSVA
jgi:hypothetical protein